MVDGCVIQTGVRQLVADVVGHFLHVCVLVSVGERMDESAETFGLEMQWRSQGRRRARAIMFLE